MSDGLTPPAAPTTPAVEPAQAPATPPAAASVDAKPEPRKLPYTRPTRVAAAPAEAAPTATATESKAEGKQSNRAAAMWRAKHAALTVELEAARKSTGEIDSMRKVLAGYASDAIKPLSKEWQDHLKELAGDDPAKLLDLVRKTEHLRASAAPAAPATTLSSAAPKAATDGDAEIAIATKYLETQKRAPGRAAAMLLQHREQINAGLKKLAG